jgi:hypothetical protein
LVGHKVFLSVPVFAANPDAIFNREHFVEQAGFAAKVTFGRFPGFDSLVGPAFVANLVPDRGFLAANHTMPGLFGWNSHNRSASRLKF